MRERQLRHVKGIENGDVGLICRGEGFLRLKRLQGYRRHPPEAILSLTAAFPWRGDVTVGDCHGRMMIENEEAMRTSSYDPGSQIREFRVAVRAESACSLSARTRLPEKRNVQSDRN